MSRLVETRANKKSKQLMLPKQPVRFLWHAEINGIPFFVHVIVSLREKSYILLVSI